SLPPPILLARCRRRRGGGAVFLFPSQARPCSSLSPPVFWFSPPPPSFPRLKVHVARKPARPHPPKSDIDHAGPRFHHVRSYQPRTSHVGSNAAHQQVGFATHPGQIPGMPMTPRHGGVAEPAPQHPTSPLPGNTASPDHDRQGPIDWHLEKVEQREDPARRTGNEAAP